MELMAANDLLGDCSEGVPPVPIPNTAVKPFSPDGTARASAWESRTLPKLNTRKSPPATEGFFVLGKKGGSPRPIVSGNLSRPPAGEGDEFLERKDLINTHWRIDHTDGNAWLHAASAVILAHENRRKHLSVATRVEGWHQDTAPIPKV